MEPLQRRSIAEDRVRPQTVIDKKVEAAIPFDTGGLERHDTIPSLAESLIKPLDFAVDTWRLGLDVDVLTLEEAANFFKNQPQ